MVGADDFSNVRVALVRLVERLVPGAQRAFRSMIELGES
jgi:hypothetical protein